MSAPLLRVEDLRAGYDGSQVLFGISLEVREGEAVTLLGRNGMGKTTTISAVIGLVRPSGGSVRVAGVRLDGAPPHRVARAGLGLVPEGRQVFPTLTVEENLVATAANRAGGAPRWTLRRVYELFPKLEQRRENLGNQLSGGEQQMLAIGRALMTNPRLLVLDEATEGLAPLVRREIWQRLEALKADGQAILIVDKNVDQLARFADRHVIIEKGEVVWTGGTDALLAQPELKDRFLHV